MAAEHPSIAASTVIGNEAVAPYAECHIPD
jgi:hypothetical protein